MSTLSGHTVVVGANNDVTLTSSNIVSTAGTSVLAGHDVITDVAAEHTLSTASKDVKKSGIMGAGIGIMIGKKQSKDNYYIDENTLYHYNRIRVGEDKLLSHILKSTDVTRGVLDSFTEDGFSAFERSLGITPSYNQYYYGGKLLGDGIGVVGGGITAGTGVIETGIFTAGGGGAGQSAVKADPCDFVRAGADVKAAQRTAVSLFCRRLRSAQGCPPAYRSAGSAGEKSRRRGRFL